MDVISGDARSQQAGREREEWRGGTETFDIIICFVQSLWVTFQVIENGQLCVCT